MYLLVFKVLFVLWELLVVLCFGMFSWDVFWAERGAMNQRYADEYGKKYPVGDMVKDMLRYDRSRSVLLSALFGLVLYVVIDITCLPLL